MDKFNSLKGIAAPLPIVNIDTDMIIPKQFLKTIKRTGLGVSLFYEMRYDNDGNLIKDFVLNTSPFDQSKILVAGDNFGCGSSREHAPWSLKDFGIKCVISTSFADIFYNNCFKNGVLPIKLSKKQIEELFLHSSDTANEIIVSLDAKKLTSGNIDYSFEVKDNLLERIIHGLDDVDITLQDKAIIKTFEDNRMKTKPWIYAND